LLQKTKKNGRKAPSVYVPLRDRPDYKAMLRGHKRLGGKILRHTAIEREINVAAQEISEYAQVHRLELIPSGKTHQLPSGGTLEWRAVGGRISCGEGSNTADLVQALKDPAINLGDCVETKEVPDETKLAERLRAHPELVEKIKEKLPGFSTGNPYELFVIGFAGEDKRVQGDYEKGTFAVAVPEKRKKR
jgi:hypothetical protein